MPKISVIIPLYNKAPYARQALLSVLDQTYQDFEIIVTDDGSKDGSQEVVKTLTDPRIRFYQNEKNLGTAGNANKLIGLSTGEYIARLDADDLMVPQRLEWQLRLMESKKEIGISSGGIELTGEKKESWKLPLEHDELQASLLFNTPIAQGASMMRHEVIKKHNLFYEETGFNVAEDWLMWYKMSKVTRFANLPETLIYYRIYEGNVTNTKNHGFYDSRKPVYTYMFKDLGLPLDKIDLHFYTKFFFKEKPSPAQVKEFYQWLQYLEKWNAEEKKFHPVFFKAQLDHTWNRFFYFMVPYGSRHVRTWFSASGFNLSKFNYFLKYRLSNMMRKRKDEG